MTDRLPSAARRSHRGEHHNAPGMACGSMWRGVLAALLCLLTAAAPACADSGTPVPMVNGYFDHTADWYRRSKRFSVEQSAARSWSSRETVATVVLYNDIRGIGTVSDNAAAPAEIRKRIAERAADIGDYLDAAARNGKVRVLLQLPDEIVERWATDQAAMAALLQEFITAWRERPALAGFYVYDEAELHGIPAATLQAIAAAIRRHARPGGNQVVFSVAYSAVAQRKPLLLAYAAANPSAFDAILVNRYPVYRAYGSGEADPAFGTSKLGLDAAKAQRENLIDNEFSNLGNYFDSLVAARRVAGLEGRPIYASMQAYGLRDDCDGPSCVPVKERKPRRSPTWGELLHMYASVWISSLDGALLYSRYFSLYDPALQKRLANLEKLMPQVFRNLPSTGPGIEVRRASGKGSAPAEAQARYAPDPQGGKSYYLVAVSTRKGAQSIQVLLDPGLRVTRIEELRFDAQGNALGPARTPFRAGSNGGARELPIELEGFAARIFQLRYD
jgi:hypothetical protein